MNWGASGVMVGVVSAVVVAKWIGTKLKKRANSLDLHYHSTNQRDEANWTNKLIKCKDLLDFYFGTCDRVLACVCVFVRHCKIPAHHLNFTTHVECRQTSAAYVATAAVQCIGPCLCLCWVVLPGAWCLEEARTSVSNCETPPPSHCTSSLNLSHPHSKHRTISCSGPFHHGVMTDSDHRGAQSGQ